VFLLTFDAGGAERGGPQGDVRRNHRGKFLRRRAMQQPEKYPWLTQLLARRPFKVVAVALANKIARIAWALMAHRDKYRAPEFVASA
jgi:hypothetical protein